MIMSDCETVDDILSEFAKRDPAGYIVWGSKISNAYRQEIKKLSNASRGNSAAMREALEKADAVFERIFSPDGFINISYAETREVTEARNEINAAISAPPRNCDAFSKAKVLEMLEDRSFSKEDTIEWLYAEAKGAEK